MNLTSRRWILRPSTASDDSGGTGTTPTQPIRSDAIRESNTGNGKRGFMAVGGNQMGRVLMMAGWSLRIQPIMDAFKRFFWQLGIPLDVISLLIAGPRT
jgi:hypothetical protein